jgi:hypothetical protein
MTAQISDTVTIDGRCYELCGVQGEGLFDPGLFDIEIEAPGPSCFRGFICSYGVDGGRLELADLELWSDPTFWSLNRTRLADLFGDSATINGDHPKVDARGLEFPICFTGGLLIGDDFIEELYKPMGFRPPYAYRDVLELTFESGRLLAKSDCSMAMLEVRLRQGLRNQEIPRDLLSWIDGSFGRDL